MQRLRQGRDLVGRQEPHPGEALGEFFKLTFGGLDACVSTNKSRRPPSSLPNTYRVLGGFDGGRRAPRLAGHR